ncbi:protein FAR1-RELATED SEQUENCE 5-like [Arachis duranensis]|uniref:Protein FAR1-RELATED SEQUENCE 5-like n=1 Tax=Arachis duranensis TaxID=130453 RepID=A0A6P4BXK3_ARADU|nr:protein FAR1-RELATED SEQUENCE 5-like [Arachis duranensis]
MENDGKESYKDGMVDLSVEYECSSDESDDMVDVTVDEAEADIINAGGLEKLITDLTIEDIWGLAFDTESQVCEFYAKYAKCYGFMSRKDLKTVDANGNINTRQLVCNKAGERHWKHLKRDNRQREHRAITRVNCKVRIRFIRHYRTGKWKVSVFQSEHNHPLCPPKYRHLIAANRKLDEADKTQADSLRACGVKTCHIMGYMVSQKGGYDKADSDPLFLGKFTLKDGRLDNLVWADGESVVDYECFGDVLAFDTTYKKNEKEFLEIMSRKLPGGVVTDGDRAMREAILEVFPGIPHRLCAWHLHRNARWNEIISKYGLAENEWVQVIYNDRMKWATAYLREHFFGRIRTTSQCEGIHSLLKNYVDSKTSLVEFMHKFSEVLRHYRNNHLTADFDTFYKFPVLTTCLESFEKQAAELYTRNIFKLVKDEIEVAGALNVTECPNSGDIVEYSTSEYFNQQWEFKVSYNKDKDLFACECRLFETRGLPCSHIFGILKHRNANCVPTSLILKRWTRVILYAQLASKTPLMI